ncbi:hypothetical protein MexAM1_META1p4831 [Methylorubrum extorquens AM1]|uniref:Uncharacterized protein n=1 Tax=Methylorubrum extorquens (strain ATCC 14718 / DSM 1338 / JCM 2805 / NCIMB 9133 / AM1) TaxID=272630 RepID=C5ARV4_METEA|nr:hypothetical protein MexAM1_META1p4831 [Methylorubrum extorquens AM1]
MALKHFLRITLLFRL